MTPETETAPIGCREPSLGAAASQMLGRPLTATLREHVAVCLACQLERRAFERFDQGVQNNPGIIRQRTRLR